MAKLDKTQDLKCKETTDEAQAAHVLAELARVLQSEYFRASRRSSLFLEFSVRYVLDKKPLGELKERVIGAEVFQRLADYDTSQDNIVRVVANDVRKRLAMFYESDQGDHIITFHLSPGSYAVKFQWAVDDACPQFPEPNKSGPTTSPLGVFRVHVHAAHHIRASWLIAVASLLVVVSVASVIVFRSKRSTDLVQSVWAPILQNQKPALICIAQPFVYGSTPNSDPIPLDVKPVRMPNQFVGIGDTFALAYVVKVFSERGKNWQILPGNSTPAESLLAGPVVIIGSHSNKWSRAMTTENQRFFFDATMEAIDDKKSNPQVRWILTDLHADWSTNEDYAIVSRFTNPASGQPVISIAGLTIYGTQAASDFITNQDLLAEALKGAPKDWRKRDFQFILHTKILGGTPERPTVIASDFH